MTAQPPDPDPQLAPGADVGGGVHQGDDPLPGSATSGPSDEADGPHRPMSTAHLVLIVLAVVAVVGLFGTVAGTALS